MTAYEQGHKAYGRGLSRDDNPHDDSYQWRLWLDGWLAARGGGDMTEYKCVMHISVAGVLWPVQEWNGRYEVYIPRGNSLYHYWAWSVQNLQARVDGCYRGQRW